MTTSVEVLAPWVERVMMEVLNTDHLHRDEDGDVPIKLDRAIMYVRFGDGPNGMPRVRLFGPLLKEVAASPELYEKLNTVNQDCSYLRFYLLDGVIWGSMEIVAESLRPEDLGNGLAAATYYSEHLPELLGLPDAKPVVDPTQEQQQTSSETGGKAEMQKELAPSNGAAAHVSVPSNVLPEDPSPADGAVNIRLGYL